MDRATILWLICDGKPGHEHQSLGLWLNEFTFLCKAVSRRWIHIKKFDYFLTP
jgi:hypothetical protein